jgi:hypothetical protein
MPERIAAPPMPKSVTSCRPAVPPPPVCGAPTGKWVAGGVAACVAWRVADGVAVGRRVAEGVDVGLAEVVGLAVCVALSVGVALPVADAVDDAEALPVEVEVADPDGEGVLVPAPEWEVFEICGVGVKTDVGPPPVQPATATAARLAPAAARTARRHTLRVTADRVTAGWVSTGTVKRTLMKPPRISGGQWHRSTHLSICHPDRQGKSERANSQPSFRPAGGIPGADRRDVRIEDHI